MGFRGRRIWIGVGLTLLVIGVICLFWVTSVTQQVGSPTASLSPTETERLLGEARQEVHQKEIQLEWYQAAYGDLSASLEEASKARDAAMADAQIVEAQLADELEFVQEVYLRQETLNGAAEVNYTTSFELDAAHTRIEELEAELAAEKERSHAAGAGAPEMPPFGDWPPPQASATTTRSLKDYQGKPFSEFDDHLCSLLEAAGYSERSYYSVPRGYVLATRMERYEADGAPAPGANRWNLDYRSRPPFSLADYIAALFTATPGRYRVILFVVTNAPFVQNPVEVDREQATRWVGAGATALPDSILDQEIPGNTRCTVLVYEFLKLSERSAPRHRRPGELTASIHMRKSGIQLFSKN